MEHAKEIELIELVAKRLEPDREKTLLAHLKDCPACRRRIEDVRGTWDILGAWEVRPTANFDAIERACAYGRAEAASGGLVIRLARIGTVLRVAATIILTMLVGYVGGRRSLGGASPRAEAETPQYVSVLGLEAGQSLSSLLLQDDEVSGGEGQS